VIKSFFQDFEHPWIKIQNFEDVSAKQILEAFPPVDDENSPPRAWVFDLDSTLFCTAPRNKRVFWRFLRERARTPQLWMKLWAALSPNNQRYSIPRTFYDVLHRELGLSSDEAWAEASLIWSEFQDFWMTEFFLSRNIARDLPYEGAVDFVRELHLRGYHIVYLTGRDSLRAYEGTYQVLREHRFPMDSRTHLRLKPHAQMEDLAFKAQASRRLDAEFDVCALIDNEPENLVMFSEMFPKAEVIFFHSIMSARLPQKPWAQILGSRKPWRMNSFHL
jgi:FMN phosphatase YigB (HAD superfamily)